MTSTVGTMDKHRVLNDISERGQYKDCRREEKYKMFIKSLCLRTVTVLAFLTIALIAVPLCLFALFIYIIWQLADAAMAAVEHRGDRKKDS